MFRPQMLEAMFVAGSILVGISGGAGAAWRRSAAVARAEFTIGYELVSGRAAVGPEWYTGLVQRLISGECR